MASGGEITKREALLVLVAVAFIGLIVAYWMIPHAAKTEELAVLSSRIEAMERVNQRARADLASGGIGELQLEAEEYARMSTALRQLVPQHNEVATLLDQVAVAARREGLELGGILPEATIPGPEFDTHRFKVSIAGGYHAVSRFLANVGSMPRIVTTVDVIFRDRDASGAASAPQDPRTQTVARVAASFEIRTYVARTEPLPGTPMAGGSQ
jgi:type IV pilus assembly protein PilO